MTTQFLVKTPAGDFTATWQDDEELVYLSGNKTAIEYARLSIQTNMVTGSLGSRIDLDSVEPADLYGFCNRDDLGITVIPDEEYLSDMKPEGEEMGANLDSANNENKYLKKGFPRLDFEGLKKVLKEFFDKEGIVYDKNTVFKEIRDSNFRYTVRATVGGIDWWCIGNYGYGEKNSGTVSIQAFRKNVPVTYYIYKESAFDSVTDFDQLAEGLQILQRLDESSSTFFDDLARLREIIGEFDVPKMKISVTLKEAKKAYDRLDYLLTDLTGHTQAEFMAADVPKRLTPAIDDLKMLIPGWPDFPRPEHLIERAEKEIKRWNEMRESAKVPEGEGESAAIRNALVLLHKATRGTFSIWNLTGDANANARVRIMEALSGTKVTKSRAGVNALESAFYDALGIREGTSAAKQNRFFRLAKSLYEPPSATEEEMTMMESAMDRAREIATVLETMGWKIEPIDRYRISATLLSTSLGAFEVIIGADKTYFRRTVEMEGTEVVDEIDRHPADIAREIDIEAKMEREFGFSLDPEDCNLIADYEENGEFAGMDVSVAYAIKNIEKAVQDRGMQLSWGDFDYTRSEGLFDSSEFRAEDFKTGRITAQIGHLGSVIGRVIITNEGRVQFMKGSTGDGYLGQSDGDLYGTGVFIDSLVKEFRKAAESFKPESKKVNSAKEGLDAIKEISPFISGMQRKVMQSNMRGEEAQYFIDKAIEIRDTIRNMPVTYGQSELGGKAIVYLHYFVGSADWYITEKDMEGDGTIQAFGLSDIGYGGELGYVSIAEITDRSVNAELDFHWTPKTLDAVRGVEDDAGEDSSDSATTVDSIISELLTQGSAWKRDGESIAIMETPNGKIMASGTNPSKDSVGYFLMLVWDRNAWIPAPDTRSIEFNSSDSAEKIAGKIYDAAIAVDSGLGDENKDSEELATREQIEIQKRNRVLAGERVVFSSDEYDNWSLNGMPDDIDMEFLPGKLNEVYLFRKEGTGHSKDTKTVITETSVYSIGRSKLNTVKLTGNATDGYHAFIVDKGTGTQASGNLNDILDVLAERLFVGGGTVDMVLEKLRHISGPDILSKETISKPSGEIEQVNHEVEADRAWLTDAADGKMDMRDTEFADKLMGLVEKYQESSDPAMFSLAERAIETYSSFAMSL